MSLSDLSDLDLATWLQNLRDSAMRLRVAEAGGLEPRQNWSRRSAYCRLVVAFGEEVLRLLSLWSGMSTDKGVPLRLLPSLPLALAGGMLESRELLVVME